MKKIIIISLFLIQTFFVSAQDMQYTQLYASSIYLNPSFAGSNVCSRFTLTYRNQWPGITTAYRSYLAAYDHYFVNKNIGLGLLAAHDVSGTGVLTTNNLNPIFAYRANINRKLSIRFGVQPGITQKSIDVSKTTFGDQIYRGGNVSTVEILPNSRTYFDAGAGTLLFSDNWWLGASFYHLNTPNESLIESEKTNLPLKTCVQGGTRFRLSEDEKTDYHKNSITLAFNYKGQGEFDQFDIGFYLKEHNANIGIWYRGLPGLKAYKPGYPNNDAVAIILGVETEKLNIGYSYDYTISSLKTNSWGAHEITLSYQMCTLKKKKRRAVLVSCPKF